MTPYFVVYFLLVILCFFGRLTNNRLFLVFIFIVLTLFAGLRFQVGVDYNNYINIFKNARDYTVNEPGFMLFLELLHFIEADFQLMFFLLAVIMQWLVYKILIRYNYDIWTSSLIYYCISPFYIATFNGVRQYLAIAVFIFVLHYIEEQKFWKYLLALLVAAFFFHLSALYLIPLYFILNKNITRAKKLLIFCGDVIISYTPYISYLFHERETHISSFTYIFAVLAILLQIIWHKVPNFPHKLLLSNVNFFCILSLIMALIQTKGIMIQMMLRINSYFFFIYILLVPAILSSGRNIRMRHLSYVFLHVILLIYQVRTIGFNGVIYDLVPYSINTNFFK